MVLSKTKQHPNTPLIQVQGLEVEFLDGQKINRVVNGVSFNIMQGETVGLVGESGCGKTVIAKSILQLLPYRIARHPAGSICFRGRELLGASPQSIRDIRGKHIGMIFQEPVASMNPLFSVEEQIVENLIQHKKMDWNEASSRALGLLEMVGISDAKRRLSAYPHELSGGQAQRVMIAMALSNGPDLLIADEPTTALDVTTQAQVLALIANLQSRLGMAILLISHDLQIVRKMSNRVCVMLDGEIVEQGETAQVFDAPEHLYTKSLLSAQPRGRVKPIPNEAATVLEASSIQVGFQIRSGILRRVTGETRAVEGIDIMLREGETVGVVGESGSGKTTLGRAVLRLVGSKGHIIFGGDKISELSMEQIRPLRRQMQIVFQDPMSSLSPRRTVEQIVGEGLAINKIGQPGKERTRLINEALLEVNIDPDTRHRYPHEFSGGQRQRIAIARVLVLKPRFIVLDEPTSSLDRSTQSQIIDLLRFLQTRHRLAYLFISHDLTVVRAIAHRVIVIKDGRLVEANTTEEIFERPKYPYTRELLKAALELEIVHD